MKNSFSLTIGMLDVNLIFKMLKVQLRCVLSAGPGLSSPDLCLPLRRCMKIHVSCDHLPLAEKWDSEDFRTRLQNTVAPAEMLGPPSVTILHKF